MQVEGYFNYVGEQIKREKPFEYTHLGYGVMGVDFNVVDNEKNYEEKHDLKAVPTYTIKLTRRLFKDTNFEGMPATMRVDRAIYEKAKDKCSIDYVDTKTGHAFASDLACNFSHVLNTNADLNVGEMQMHAENDRKLFDDLVEQWEHR